MGMKLRMHRYFKKCENTENIKSYLGECSIGDWFVLYQMSKNMNRRLFFMFVTKLAKVPRSEILNLLPQIRVVKAFQESVKKSKPEKNSLEGKKEEDLMMRMMVMMFVLFMPEKKKSERRNQRKGK